MYQNHSEQAIQQTKPRVYGTYLITMQFISAIITQLIFDSRGDFCAVWVYWPELA